MKSIEIRIGGRVQGVGFRYFALHKAKELQVAGWVKNTSDGKVEIEASGEPERIDVFVDWMKIGPQRCRIDLFVVNEIVPSRNFTDFIIR